MAREPARRRVALGCASVLAAGLLTAGCGGGSDETTTTTAAHGHSGNNGISAHEKRAATRRLKRELGGKGSVSRLKHGHGLPATHVRPAEIVPDSPGPFFSSDVIYPFTNGWQAGDKHTYTAIDAGANPANPSMGELGIFRQDHIKVTQSQKVVNVPGAGTVRIVRAPEGPAVATSAQRSGEIEFAGSRGVRGTLHLSDDSVTISRRGSAT